MKVWVARHDGGVEETSLSIPEAMNMVRDYPTLNLFLWDGVMAIANKVPLVHHIDGERRVIGEATLDFDEDQVKVTTTITDERYNSVPRSLGFDYATFFTIEDNLRIPRETAAVPRWSLDPASLPEQREKKD